MGSIQYSDRLEGAINRAGSPACVGIDPVLGRLPDGLSPGDDIERIREFCLGVVETVAGVVPAIKPQSACFERFGSAGVAVLEQVCARARKLGLLIVLDVKRGDIGSTAEHYAGAAVGMGADAVTVNGYMGRSAVLPFVESGLGVYVLVRTSNPDSDELQAQALAGGGTVAERMARMVCEMGVGAVVGATKNGDELARLRALMPEAPILVPGVGAQGGTVEGVRPMVREGTSSLGEAGVLINASRSVLYPASGGGDWRVAIRSAAESFAAEAAGALP